MLIAGPAIAFCVKAYLRIKDEETTNGVCWFAVLIIGSMLTVLVNILHISELGSFFQKTGNIMALKVISMVLIECFLILVILPVPDESSFLILKVKADTWENSCAGFNIPLLDFCKRSWNYS